MRRIRWRLGALTLALVGLAGCGSEKDAEAFVVRDSAGIRIAESVAPTWQTGAGWTIAADPAVRIGQVDGDAAYLLERPRGVLRLDDGRIVVADNGGATVRWYDEAGRHLVTAGGPGGGPGEFTFLQDAYTDGDSVFVLDGQHSTLTVFGPEGAFARTFPLTWPAQFAPPPFARTSDGGWLASGSADGGGTRTGLVAFRSRVYRYGPEGELMDTLFEHPSGEGFLAVCGADGRAICNNGPWFARRAARAVVGERIFTGDGGGYDIAVHDARTGQLEGRVRRLAAATPVARADARRVLDEAVNRYPEERQPEIRAVLGPVPAADSLPAYAALHGDDAGNLWVERYRFPWDDVPIFDVFDAEGRWLGPVTAPAGLQVHQVGDDFVLGIITDDMGVQRVVLHDVVKSPPI